MMRPNLRVGWGLDFVTAPGMAIGTLGLVVLACGAKSETQFGAHNQSQAEPFIKEGDGKQVGEPSGQPPKPAKVGENGGASGEPSGPSENEEPGGSGAPLPDCFVIAGEDECLTKEGCQAIRSTDDVYRGCGPMVACKGPVCAVSPDGEEATFDSCPPFGWNICDEPG